MNATDIKEHREERPRLYGSMPPYQPQYMHVCQLTDNKHATPIAKNGETFELPSAAEQSLLEEREMEVDHLLVSVERKDSVFAEAAVARIRTIDRQLAELRGAK